VLVNLRSDFLQDSFLRPWSETWRQEIRTQIGHRRCDSENVLLIERQEEK